MNARLFVLMFAVSSFVSLAPLALAQAPLTGGSINPPTGGNPPPAQGGGSAQNITLINPLNSGDCTPNGDCLMNFLNKILQLVIRIGAIAVVLMLVYVGYLFVVAQGNPEAIVDARKDLLWTLIGALILLGAQAISFGIEATVKALSVGK